MLDPGWRVLVISLPDDSARRAALLPALEALGLKPHIIEAIDGRQGLPPWAEAEVDRAAAAARVGRPLADAELACALSHRRGWQYICDTGAPGALIFEDDAILTDRFAPLLAAGGHKAADLVQFDHQDARIWRTGFRRAPEITLGTGQRLVPVAENASLANGYALSARAAASLVAAATPVAGLADWPCATTPLGALIALPPVISHPAADPAQSRLEGARRMLVNQTAAAGGGWRRRLHRPYWRRWWFKRRTRKVS